MNNLVQFCYDRSNVRRLMVAGRCVRRRFVAVTLTIVFSLSAIAPALADANYNPSNPLLALFPDICTLFASCITFTDSTAINGMNSVVNQIQEGEMHVQDLRSGPLGQLGRLGIGDPAGGNLLGTILRQTTRSNPTQAGLACNNGIAGAAAGNRTDLLSLLGVQQAFGVGHLSSGQISSVVMQKLASSAEAQSQCKAAESMAAQANVAKSYTNFGAEFDLGGDVLAGWP